MSRIGCDASHLAWRRTGTSRYVEGLLGGLAARLAAGDALLAYTNAAQATHRLDPRVRERCIRLPSPRATAWTQLRLPLSARLDGCDVLLAHHVAPLWSGLPTVLVVYDCLAFRHPSAKPGAEGAYFRRWMPRSAQRATRRVAISRFAAQEAERWLGVPADSFAIAYPGVGAGVAATAEADRARARAALAAAARSPDAPYILQVGAAGPHKGAAVLATAVGLLRGDHPELGLVRCGPSGGDGGTAGGVDLGVVGEAELRGLYAGAAAVCVASSHEGFGLPVVEAMANGTPVVAADTGGIREAGGDAAIYVAPGDPVSLAAGLRRALDPAVAASMREAGRRQAARFTWEATADVVLGALRQAAGRRGGR